jgi:L-fuconolactonase
MLIADSQVHIWAASTPERPWPARHAPHRPVPFSKDDLLREMDAAGVHRAVIVPPGWEGERNDLALQAARLHPDRLAVMGALDINAPGARGEIARWRKQPGMLGLRLILRTLADSATDWVWAEAEAAQVPIMVAAAKQLDLVDRAAERYPGLKLVIDHLAIPMGAKDEAAFAHMDELIELAKRPNIAVKATGLPSCTTDTYPYRRLHPQIRRVYDAFGPSRMFWGTDFTKLPCSYRQAVTLFTEELPWLTAEDKDWIMGRGLCEWIGWKLP